jgi:predicted RNA-binding Zn-ribbon protein involved in translation (DUF1610 family)
MKPKTMLKDVLKPPFKKREFPVGCYVTDSNDHPVCMNLTMNKSLTDKGIERLVADFIVDAINERWKREFSEPIRWKEESYEHSEIVTWHCPECEEGYVIGRAEWQSFFYCPKCGVNLLPPKTMYWKWSDSGNEYVCPACEHEADDDEPYCPSCGVRLLPLEDGEPEKIMEVEDKSEKSDT